MEEEGKRLTIKYFQRGTTTSKSLSVFILHDSDSFLLSIQNTNLVLINYWTCSSIISVASYKSI